MKKFEEIINSARHTPKFTITLPKPLEDNSTIENKELEEALANNEIPDHNITYVPPDLEQQFEKTKQENNTDLEYFQKLVIKYPQLQEDLEKLDDKTVIKIAEQDLRNISEEHLATIFQIGSTAHNIALFMKKLLIGEISLEGQNKKDDIYSIIKGTPIPLSQRTGKIQLTDEEIRADAIRRFGMNLEDISNMDKIGKKFKMENLLLHKKDF